MKDDARLVELEKFARWVLDEIFDEDLWSINQDAFPEIACRKLVKLGLVGIDGDYYYKLETEDGDGDD